MAGIPINLDFYDSSSDGIANSIKLKFWVICILLCLADALNNVHLYYPTPVFKAPGTALFPRSIHPATTKRTTNVLMNSSHTTVLLPAPSAYEYVSEGAWTTSAYMTNTLTISKTWFSVKIAGLTRTLSLKNGT